MDFTAQPATVAQETSIETFSDHVIGSSQSRPVLVDFYADWSEASKELSANLEREVARSKGAVGLARVNIDMNKTLVAQLQIQSAPTVLVFFQGQPVDGFQGAVPSDQLAMIVDRLMQVAGAANGQGGETAESQEDPIESALDDVAALKDAGQHTEAALLLDRILEVAPGHPKACLLKLENQLNAGAIADVEAGLADLDRASYEDAEDLALISRLDMAVSLRGEGDPGADTEAFEKKLQQDPLDHETRFSLALTHQSRGNLADAAEALLGIIMRDRSWQDDKARKQLLKLFDAAGVSDSFTLKYRRRLSSVLFS